MKQLELFTEPKKGLKPSWILLRQNLLLRDLRNFSKTKCFLMLEKADSGPFHENRALLYDGTTGHILAENMPVEFVSFSVESGHHWGVRREHLEQAIGRDRDWEEIL